MVAKANNYDIHQRKSRFVQEKGLKNLYLHKYLVDCDEL